MLFFLSHLKSRTLFLSCNGKDAICLEQGLFMARLKSQPSEVVLMRARGVVEGWAFLPHPAASTDGYKRLQGERCEARKEGGEA